MHRRNDDDDDRFQRSPEAGDSREPSNAIPLAGLATALMGIPAVRVFDWFYCSLTGAHTLVPNARPLLLIPAAAGVTALVCLFRTRYREPRPLMILIFTLFIASFWLGLGLFVFGLLPRPEH